MTDEVELEEVSLAAVELDELELVREPSVELEDELLLLD